MQGRLLPAPRSRPRAYMRTFGALVSEAANVYHEFCIVFKGSEDIIRPTSRLPMPNRYYSRHPCYHTVWIRSIICRALRVSEQKTGCLATSVEMPYRLPRNASLILSLLVASSLGMCSRRVPAPVRPCVAWTGADRSPRISAAVHHQAFERHRLQLDG
jgi:hypothetical protein